MLNAIDDTLDILATGRDLTEETIATLALLVDHIDWAAVAQKIWYAVKFACYFVYFAGQAAGEWYRSNNIDAEITAGLKGFMPAVEEGRSAESAKVWHWLGAIGGRLAARVADGLRWMLVTGEEDLLEAARSGFRVCDS